MSFHDTPELLDEILTAHPELDFVQLQINYIDWENPGIQSRRCYEVARKHNKPIVVMEPCKGGNLALVPENAEELMKAYNPEASIASWAIRFAASLEGVMMVLSGMNTMEQVLIILQIWQTSNPLMKKNTGSSTR
jgi:predicted aldo/keto reductase-like oxidoreductase